MNNNETNITDLLKHKKFLKKYLKLIINESETDDIIQNAFMKMLILNNEKKLNSKNLKSLLFVIAKNDALSVYNRNKNYIKVNINECENHIDYINDVHLLFFEELDKSTDLNVILIKEQCDGATIKELSIKYKLTEAAIKSRLFNTKKKLKEKYKIIK